MPLPAPMPAAPPWRNPGAWSVVSILGVAVVAAGGFLRWGGTSSMQIASFWAVLAVSHVGLALAGGVEWPSGPHDGHWLIGVVLAVLVAPAIFLVALFAVVKMMLSGTPPITRAAGWLLAAAAVMKIAVQAGAVNPAAAAIPAIMAGDVLAAGTMLAAVVAQWRRTGMRSKAGAGRTRRPYSRLPYGALATTNAILVVALVANDRSWHLWVVLAGVLVSFTLVVVRQMGTLRDIATLLTERDALAASLREQAYRDALTGLPNRSRFIELLSAAETEVLVLFVDLNSFKPVNDEYGHAAGDALLVEVGRRLQQCVGPDQTIARLGGDEYAVMVRDVPADLQDDLIDRIRAAIEQPFVVRGAAVRVGASVGAARGYVADGGTDALLHRADMAMYAQKKQAKYAGR